MKVSRGQTAQAAPPTPQVTALMAQYSDDLEQMLAQVSGHPQLVEEGMTYSLAGPVFRQKYVSHADGMEFIITVENGKIGFVSANTVGAR